LFLLLGDHAGNHIPRRLGSLGLPPEELSRHIALDIGIAELGRDLAGSLDAPFVEQRYSRLVVDCNRSKEVPDSIAAVSDGTVISGNSGLGSHAIEQRHREIFDPYHAEIEHVIDARRRQGRATVLVSLHSFAPVLAGKERPWDIGVLYQAGDTRFARHVLDELGSSRELCVGDNEPYRMDSTDFTIPRHAHARRLPYVELETRQDHLRAPAGLAKLSAALAGALVRAAVVASR
jgi:predicted N-formylglutamate amidohydrolase